MGEKEATANAGTIDPELLSMLCCPETKQNVTLADTQLIQELNQAIENGKLQNKAGQQVTEKLDGGIIRDDRKVLYPIKDQIPIMLIDEGIELSG